MATSQVKCPNCEEIVYCTVNGFCKHCQPDLVKSLSEIDKEYTNKDKQKMKGKVNKNE